MKLTVSFLAVFTIVAVQVVVQAGHSFVKLPAQRAAPWRYAAISARNEGGDSTPKLLRRNCKGRPISSGSPAPSPSVSFAGSPLASASELTIVLTSTSTLTVPATLSLASASTPGSTTALPAASSPASASSTASTTSTKALPSASSLTSAPTPPATSSAPQPSTSDNGPTNNSGGGPIDGLVNVISSKSCGSSGATEEVTALSGPNGHINFLTCGINGTGWNPPLINIKGIVTVDLSAVAYQNDSAFANCQDFVATFEHYGSQYGIPAILLASFAMQESSCIPSTVGGAGEQGLMQLTSDKCVGAPNGDCMDVDFNIGAGAMFFSQLLDENDGNLLSSIGHYNGWFQGMTYANATAAAHGGNCREQNNLDYLHQFLNGWCQNINTYEHNPPLGEYFNLNVCN